jgi:ATP-dependent Clp protease ATP-binding subunit ClpA
MEKAHPQIQDYFLQVFDQGKARDSRGRWIDFRRQLFILTTNLSADSKADRQIGFLAEDGKSPAGLSEELDETLAQHFRAEFLARIDRIIPFHALSLEDYQQILQHRLSELQEDIKRRYSARLEVSDGAQQYLYKACAEQSDDARKLIRRFERMLVAPLLEYLEQQTRTEVVKVDMDGSRLVFH